MMKLSELQIKFLGMKEELLNILLNIYLMLIVVSWITTSKVISIINSWENT